MPNKKEVVASTAAPENPNEKTQFYKKNKQIKDKSQQQIGNAKVKAKFGET